MKMFLQDLQGSKLQDGVTEYKITKRYIEFTQKLENWLVVTYFIFRDESSFIVALCWDDMFNSLEIKDTDDIENIGDTYPTLAGLIRNTINRNFGRGALIQMEDFDDGSLKWFVISIAGNLEIKSPEDLFEGRAQEAAETVLLRSLEVLGELKNKPKLGGTIWRGLKKGMLMGLKDVLSVSLNETFSSIFNMPENYAPAEPESVIKKKSFEEYFNSAMNERRKRGL